ncbi:MAG: carboxymuconolactone decarboxylase family protein [Flavobacteriales bacterium]|jgi:AhpD family alkylhydroperoxidase|nr:carboxymuconolactone decarboxylase family protein [Flavobacteriales bacterium]
MQHQQTYKKKYSLIEFYKASVLLAKAIVLLVRNNKNKVIDQLFIQRIHLAVTEVNGCPVCSYEHTKMALKKGMSNEEISSFLSGQQNFIQPYEAKAIAFSQHYAATRGFPKNYTYNAIIKEYGTEKAAVILAAIQIMMVGNMYGLPFSAFKARLKGKAYSDSTLGYEISMLLLGGLLLPIAIIHGFLKLAVGVSNDHFDLSPSF